MEVRPSSSLLLSTSHRRSRGGTDSDARRKSDSNRRDGRERAGLLNVPWAVSEESGVAVGRLSGWRREGVRFGIEDDYAEKKGSDIKNIVSRRTH